MTFELITWGELSAVGASAASTTPSRKVVICPRLLRCIAFTCMVLTLPECFAQGFPSPTGGYRLGYRDASGEEEIGAYLQASSAADWRDLRASGNITYSGGETYSTEVYLLGANYSRMDVMLADGTRSIRMNRSAGRLEDTERGGVDLPHTNVSAGLFAFPRVWTEARSPSRVAVVDRGQYSVAGVILHRVTMEYAPEPLAQSRNLSTYAMDLYFSTTTHLLTYSVDTISSSGLAPQPMLRINEYDDYQRINGLLIPMRITQTVDGQLSWDLRFSEIETNTSLSTSIFEF